MPKYVDDKKQLLIMIYAPRNKKLKSVSIEQSVICEFSVCTITVFPVEICLNVGKKFCMCTCLLCAFHYVHTTKFSTHQSPN